MNLVIVAVFYGFKASLSVFEGGDFSIFCASHSCFRIHPTR